MNVPDNYDAYEHHEIEMEKRLSRLPECDFCGERIQQDKALHIMGLWICDDCINDNMRWIEE